MTQARNWLLYGCLLVILSVWAFGDLRHHNWAFDDEDYIENARIAQTRFIHILSPEKAWAARPVVHFYFWAAYPIFGDDPGYYHLANAALHTLVAFSCALLFHGLGGGFAASTVAGVLFLVNVAHFRAVYWISGVGLLLGTLFGLVSALCLLGFLNRGKPIDKWASLFFFTAAVFAHEAAVVFLGLLGILIWRSRGRKGLKLLAPYLPVAFALWAVSRYVYPTPLAEDDGYGLGSHVFLNFLNGIFFLISGSHHDMSWLGLPAPAKAVMGFLIAAVLLVISWRHGQIRLVLLWVFISLLPYLPWRDRAEAWRYFYTPASGSSTLYAMLLLWTARRAAALGRRRWLRPAAWLSLGGLLVWSSLRHTDGLQAVQYAFSARHFQKKGDFRQALVEYRRAEDLAHPRRAFRDRVKFNGAVCMLEVGEVDGAYGILSEIAVEYPEYGPVYRPLLRAYRERHGLRDVSRGVSQEDVLSTETSSSLRASIDRSIKEGEWRHAEALCLLYLHFLPGDLGMRTRMAAVHEKTGREEQGRRELMEVAGVLNEQACDHIASGQYDAAESLLVEAIRLAPGVAYPHFNLGDAYWRAGKWALCVEEWETVLELAPDDGNLKRLLADRLRTARERAMEDERSSP
ncbi:MAG: tetratricopeptide repeat protein [Candidatus Eisenbacteria bacterium]